MHVSVSRFVSCMECTRESIAVKLIHGFDMKGMTIYLFSDYLISGE